MLQQREAPVAYEASVRLIRNNLGGPDVVGATLKTLARGRVQKLMTEPSAADFNEDERAGSAERYTGQQCQDHMLHRGRIVARRAS